MSGRMRMSGMSLAALMLAGLALAGCRAGQPTPARAEITVGDETITVEIADTPARRERGLMFRDRLDADAGMLFVFDREEPVSFYMRNTRVPLSIAFIAADGVIVRLDDMRPLTDDLHPSGVPVLYALEMNRGWFARHGIGAGTRVVLPANLRARP